MSHETIYLHALRAGAWCAAQGADSRICAAATPPAAARVLPDERSGPAAQHRPHLRAAGGGPGGARALGRRPAARHLDVHRHVGGAALQARDARQDPRPAHLDEVTAALASKIQALPESLFRSLTWDHGKEMSEHAKFTIDTGVQVYFGTSRAWDQADASRAASSEDLSEQSRLG